MSDLRTAAQQALEAIRIFREWEMGQDYHSNRDTVLARAFAAEETLEAALTEPVQKPVGVLRTLVQIHPDGTETWREDPVWIAPPQRKPLTEEEIGAAANSVRWSEQYHIKFARAIERAHGIE